MSEVTHLSDNFYQEIADITTKLRQQLTWGEYKEFYELAARKKLLEATSLLEKLHDSKSTINCNELVYIRDRTGGSWHDLYRSLKDMLEKWEQFDAVAVEWFDLMLLNDGAENAAKLVKKNRKQLPIREPAKITVLRTLARRTG